MKKILLILTLCYSSSNVFTQENDSTQSELRESKHFAGVHAGGSTGFGFSYRWIPNNFGIQITGIPIFEGNNDFYSSTAISFLYTLSKHEKISLFVYQGNHVTYTAYETFVYPDPWNPIGIPEVQKIRETQLNLGLGAGMNIHLFENYVDLSLQVGYGLYNVTKNLRTNITGEIGLYYCF